MEIPQKNVQPFLHQIFFSTFNNNSDPNSDTSLSNGTKLDRRTLEYKRTRKTCNRKCEFIMLDCHESDLLRTFKQAFGHLLSTRNSSVDCCNIIVNSLAAFFSQNTWSCKVQENVMEFLYHFVIQDSDELCQRSVVDDDYFPLSSEKMLLKIQIMCLLELFFAKFSMTAIQELNIIEKLFLIQYVYGKAETHKFIIDILQPEFGSCLPSHMSMISDVLRVPIPVKKRKLSNSGSTNDFGGYEFSRRIKGYKNKRDCVTKNSCEKSELTDDISEESVLEPFSSPNRSATLDESTCGFEEEYTEDNGDINNVDDSSPSKKSEPSPDEEDEFEFDTKEEKSPPKQAKKSSIRPKMVNAPLKYSCRIKQKERLLLVRDAKNPIKKAAVAVSSPGVQNTRRLSGTASLLSNIKKTEKFVDVKATSSAALPSPTINNRSSALESSKNVVGVLDDKVISKYKKRMETIKSNARSINSNAELFYGRSHARQGLFDDLDEKTEHGNGNNDRSTAQTQTNRSGRAIKAPLEDRVYVAHTLLNVYNTNPLAPFKIRNTNSAELASTFKIRKLIKPANRTERRRMERFKQRTLSAVPATPPASKLVNAI